MNHVDQNWIQLQHRSFLNWINSHLRKQEIQLSDLGEDFKSGENLLRLLSLLLEKPIEIPIENPQFRIQMMNNLSEALKIIKQSCGIELINIDSNDIVDGNLKLTLAMVYSLMYKYQVCKAMSDDDSLGGNCSKDVRVIDQNTPISIVEKQLIDWLNSVLYNNEPRITNIGTDWQNGDHLRNLVQYFIPNLVIDSEDPNMKISTCIERSEKDLEIPKLLEASDIVNGPDRFSMLAYLSYFRMAKKRIERSNTPQLTQVVSPVQQQLPPPQISTSVSSVNIDDMSSAPPMSPPPSQEFEMQSNVSSFQPMNQQPISQPSYQNWNHHHQQPVSVQPQQQSQYGNLTTSTYLPGGNTGSNTSAHPSSIYSPNVNNNFQLIPSIPSNHSHHQQQVSPQPQTLSPFPQQYPPQLSPQQQYGQIPPPTFGMSPQFSPQQPMVMDQQMQQQYQMSPQPMMGQQVFTTTTTTNHFPTDMMSPYGYYQYY